MGGHGTDDVKGIHTRIRRDACSLETWAVFGLPTRAPPRSPARAHPTGLTSRGSPTPSGSAPEPTASLGLRPPETPKRPET